MKEKENMEKVEMKKTHFGRNCRKKYTISHTTTVKLELKKELKKIANLLAKQLNKYNDFGAAEELFSHHSNVFIQYDKCLAWNNWW